MNGHQEYWHIGDLHSDPRNAELFDAMEEKELHELAASIRGHGLINPLTISPDGVLIAGEQRWRAAQLAGLELVPVVVRDVTGEEAEALRIEENLRRRTLKPSETVRAVKRLADLKGMSRQWRGDITQGNNEPAPAEEIARETGYTPKQVSVIASLSGLIAPLMALHDAGKISQKVAYQLAQMAPEDQETIARIGGVDALDKKKAEQEVKALKKRLEEMEKGATVAPLSPPSAGDPQAKIVALQLELKDLEEQKNGELARLKLQKDAEIARLLKVQPTAEASPPAPEIATRVSPLTTDEEDDRYQHGERRFEQKYHLSRLITPLAALTSIPLEEMQGAIDYVPNVALFAGHKNILDRVIPWLQEYARLLGERTGQPNPFTNRKAK